MKKQSLTHLEQVDRVLTEIRNRVEELDGRLKEVKMIKEVLDLLDDLKNLTFTGKDAINKSIREEE